LKANQRFKFRTCEIVVPQEYGLVFLTSIAQKITTTTSSTYH